MATQPQYLRTRHGDEPRVVVVDDSADIAEALAATLALDGYDVRTAGDGEIAMQVIAEHQPHCVLLDVHLPKVNGSQLATRLRAQYGDDIVLIAITGYERSDIQVRNTFDCVDHYLVKPVDLDQLRRLLPPTAATRSATAP